MCDVYVQDQKLILHEVLVTMGCEREKKKRRKRGFYVNRLQLESYIVTSLKNKKSYNKKQKKRKN